MAEKRQHRAPEKTPSKPNSRTPRRGRRRPARGASFSHGSRDLSPGGAFGRATAGSPGALPYQAEMEQAFGRSFSHVRAHVGGKAQRDGLSAIDANAAARGDVVCFSEATPSKETVGHELAHVVQGSMGVSASSTVSRQSDAAEVEAEQVGARVAAGRPAGPIVATAVGIHRESPRREQLDGQEATDPEGRPLLYGEDEAEGEKPFGADEADPLGKKERSEDRGDDWVEKKERTEKPGVVDEKRSKRAGRERPDGKGEVLLEEDVAKAGRGSKEITKTRVTEVYGHGDPVATGKALVARLEREQESFRAARPGFIANITAKRREVQAAWEAARDNPDKRAAADARRRLKALRGELNKAERDFDQAEAKVASALKKLGPKVANGKLTMAELKRIAATTGQGDVAVVRKLESRVTRVEKEIFDGRALTEFKVSWGGGRTIKTEQGPDDQKPKGEGEIITNELGVNNGELKGTRTREDALGNKRKVTGGYDAKTGDLKGGVSEENADGDTASANVTINPETGERSVALAAGNKGEKDKRGFNGEVIVGDEAVGASGDVDALKWGDTEKRHVTFNIGGGLTVTCQVRDVPGSNPPRVTLTAGFNGNVTIGGTAGTKETSAPGGSASLGATAKYTWKVNESWTRTFTAEQARKEIGHFGRMENGHPTFKTKDEWAAALKLIGPKLLERDGDAHSSGSSHEVELGANGGVKGGIIGVTGAVTGKWRFAKNFSESRGGGFYAITVRLAEGRSVATTGGASSFGVTGEARYSYDWDNAESRTFKFPIDDPKLAEKVDRVKGASSVAYLDTLVRQYGLAGFKRERAAKDSFGGGVGGENVGNLDQDHSTDFESATEFDGKNVNSKHKGGQTDKQAAKIKEVTVYEQSETNAIEAESRGEDAMVVISEEKTADDLSKDNLPTGSKDALAKANGGLVGTVRAYVTRAETQCQQVRLDTGALGKLTKRAKWPEWKGVPGAAGVGEIQGAWNRLGAGLRAPRSVGNQDLFKELERLSPEDLAKNGLVAADKKRLLREMAQANRMQAFAEFGKTGKKGRLAIEHACFRLGKDYWGNGSAASGIGTREAWGGSLAKHHADFDAVIWEVSKLRSAISGYVTEGRSGMNKAVATVQALSGRLGKYKHLIGSAPELKGDPPVRFAMLQEVETLQARVRETMAWFRTAHGKHEASISPNECDVDQDVSEEPPVNNLEADVEVDPAEKARADAQGQLPVLRNTLLACKRREQGLFAQIAEALNDYEFTVGVMDTERTLLQTVARHYEKWMPIVKQLRRACKAAGLSPAEWLISAGPGDRRSRHYEPNPRRAAKLYKKAWGCSEDRAWSAFSDYAVY